MEKICVLSYFEKCWKVMVMSCTSHCTFRKEGCRLVTIPKHEPIKRVYVEMVKKVIESKVDIDDVE